METTSLSTKLQVLNYTGRTILLLSMLVSQSVQAQVNRIFVSLPVEAKINLIGNRSARIGQVIAIIPQKSQIKIQGEQNQQLINITDIETLKFSPDALAFKDNGGPIMRGKQNAPLGLEETLGPFPLNSLKIKDPARGRAELIVGTPKSKANILTSRSYILNEIKFEAKTGSMTIRATPYQ